MISSQFTETVEDAIDWSDLGLLLMREVVIDEDGEMIYEAESEHGIPNALTNDGQASMLNVRFRGIAAPVNDWLMLLNMPSNAAGNPGKTALMTTITESAIVGAAAGYGRVSLAPADWAAPGLNLGDQQIAAAQKSFGFPFVGNISVSHIALCSQVSLLSGSIYLFVANSYYVNNLGNPQVFANGQQYLVTLQEKQV